MIATVPTGRRTTNILQMLSKSVDRILRPLKECPVQAYLSNQLQVADVVEWCLSQMSGEATVCQTSFSISEEFIRRLYHMRRAGKVKGIQLLLDHKATNKTLRLWPFIVQTIDSCFLADNHSKLILLKGSTTGEVTQVAIITSQNLTRGNRHECAIVTTDPEIFSTLEKEFQDMVKYHSVPLHELYKSKICQSPYI